MRFTGSSIGDPKNVELVENLGKPQLTQCHLNEAMRHFWRGYARGTPETLRPANF